MQVPLGVLAVLATIGGFLNTGKNPIMATFLKSTVQNVPYPTPEIEGLMLALTALVIVSVVGLTAWMYIKRTPSQEVSKNWIYLFSFDKFYVDEVYTFCFVTPYMALARGVNQFVEKTLASWPGAISMSGVKALAYPFKKAQNGQLGIYVLAMTIGIICVLIGALL
jgi:NADH-quinone oxidoreductase subunit L